MGRRGWIRITHVDRKRWHRFPNRRKTVFKDQASEVTDGPTIVKPTGGETYAPECVRADSIAWVVVGVSPFSHLRTRPAKKSM